MFVNVYMLGHVHNNLTNEIYLSTEYQIEIYVAGIFFHNEVPVPLEMRPCKFVYCGLFIVFLNAVQCKKYTDTLL